MNGPPVAPRAVDAIAPIRICDIGGWTDTWFAEHGNVFNIGVSPYVHAHIAVHPAGALANRIVLEAENYADHYSFAPGDLPGRHPLLESAIDEIGLPDAISVAITIASAAPAGSSTGTSAAATVALIAALDALTPGRKSPHEIAYAAHRIEVERLGMQSGIQDQLCSAYGGINFIEMSSYPHASVSQIPVTDAVRRDLEHRLVLVFLGRAHVSSEVHDGVVAALEGHGHTSPELDALRRTARDARDAVYAADLPALGRAMIDNTDAQRRLHDGLVCSDAQTVIDIARSNGALGWKVNGAGGEGGSLTVLCPRDEEPLARVLSAIREASSEFKMVPIRLSRHGVRVRET